ncbi:hypothetical protein [Steroidobacter denitrificans]|nr:hypothetical protein [Steroidobacter denitrificans]
MTPADRRIKELIDKWLASIDLHLKYVELGDTDYAHVQPWPKHDRPTRWVLEVARQKILELQAHAESRRNMNDAKFAESLELMAFLANLVGIQHIQRFIPLAGAHPGQQEEPSVSASSLTLEAPGIAATRPVRSVGDDTTREMPRLTRAAGMPAAAPVAPEKKREKDPGKNPGGSTGALPPGSPASKVPVKSNSTKTVATKTHATSTPADMRDRIIADAVRLLKWGRPWHELAELIARIAERPPVGEVRKILRANKSDIEAKTALR